MDEPAAEELHSHITHTTGRCPLDS